MKNILSEIIIDTGACRGCSGCVSACPAGVLRIKEDRGRKYATTVWSVRCTSCGDCVAACPESAIQVENYELIHSLA